MQLLFSVILEHSYWFILLCLFVGSAVATGLYYKDRKLKDAPRNIKIILFSIRFFVVSFLCFLLLSPFIESIYEKIQKPVVVFAVDNSESVVLNRDSVFVNSEFKKKLSELQAKVSEKYDIETLAFGESVRNLDSLNYSDKTTNFSDLFEQMELKYFNRNIGALVFVSDAIPTEGKSAFYAYEQNKIEAPVYSVAMGDTILSPDLLIKDVRYNPVCFLDAKFPLGVTVAAHFLKGEKYQVSVFCENKLVVNDEVVISRDDFLFEHEFYIEPQNVGVMQYQIVLTKLANELTYQNNSTTIILEVLKRKNQVLLLYEAPHPDIAALKNSINKNINYEVEVASIKDFNKKPEDYNLVILYQLPSTRYGLSETLNTLNQKEIPVLYILGQNTNLEQFSKASEILQITSKNKSFDEVTPFVTNDFALFDVSEEEKVYFLDLPPLYVPYGDYVPNGNSKTFIIQKVGKVQTTKPLVVFNEKEERRTGVICGEGIWRWKIQDLRLHKNSNYFDGLVNKIVVYLSLKEKKEQFKVKYETIYNENEDVLFVAEVYNDSYQLVNSGEVKLTITDSLKHEYPFVFSKSGSVFRLNAGSLPVGNYTFSAETTYDNKTLVKKGMFSVIPVTVEALNTLSNYNDLYKISNNSGGAVYSPHDLDKLAERILQDDAIVSVSHSIEELRELVQQMWILILLIILMSVEWFLRKYYATY